MTKKEFEYKCKNYNGVPITNNYILWPKMRKIKRKPVCVSHHNGNDENFYFVTIAESLEFVLDDGRKILDIIETWTDMPDLVLDGPIIWHTK